MSNKMWPEAKAGIAAAKRVVAARKKDTRITDEICPKVAVSVTAEPEHFEAICSMIVGDANRHLMECSGVGIDVGSYRYKSVNAVLQPNSKC